MHRYLVVAHHTLTGPQLAERLGQLAAHGPTAFHIVVPAEPPGDHTWTETEARRTAQARLDRALARFGTIDARFTSEVGDPNPLLAVDDVLLRDPDFDAIVVSTLPPGPSRWLKRDLPHRLEERTGLRVIHVVGSAEPVSAAG
jgi:hypothetical protein